MLPILLEQRRQLLTYLESSVVEISKYCMPSAKPPVTCLECPLLHEDNSTPHIVLDINKKDVLMCQKMLLATPVPEESYILLYQGSRSQMHDYPYVLIVINGCVTIYIYIWCKILAI